VYFFHCIDLTLRLYRAPFPLLCEKCFCRLRGNKCEHTFTQLKQEAHNALKNPRVIKHLFAIYRQFHGYFFYDSSLFHIFKSGLMELRKWQINFITDQFYEKDVTARSYFEPQLTK
jgi:hypothetical protein